VVRVRHVCGRIRISVEPDQELHESVLFVRDDEPAPDKPRRGKRPSPVPPPSDTDESAPELKPETK
jgi:hypothetical protein